MKVRLNSKQYMLVIAIIAMNLFAITQGFIYHSFWGILLACGSVGALIFCLQLLAKIQKLNSEEEIIREDS